MGGNIPAYDRGLHYRVGDSLRDRGETMIEDKYQLFVQDMAVMVREGEPAPAWAFEIGHVDEDGRYSPELEAIASLLDALIAHARSLVGET